MQNNYQNLAFLLYRQQIRILQRDHRVHLEYQLLYKVVETCLWDPGTLLDPLRLVLAEYQVRDGIVGDYC